MKRILLIDNDIDFVDACRNFLDAAGYEVGFETKEENALSEIINFKPDIILLDVIMDTETSGFTIADKICAEESLKRIPVVFLSGYFRKEITNGKGNELSSRWENVKGLIDKPVKPEALIKIIERL
jgi:CheY-like chemotaxis protein